MNFDEFVKKYNGQAIDYDGGFGVQCVDLIKLYAEKVLGLKFGAFGNAHAYYDNFENIKMLKDNFIKIKNTPDFVPQKGDIIIWNTRRGNGAGHIALCNGIGTKNYFCSYDMNWNGVKAMQLIKHTYSNVLGVIRFKNQNLNTLKNGDTLTLTDNQNGTISYKIYHKYKAKANQTYGLSQRTNGKREVTLITCCNYSNERLIIKAREI